MIIEELITEIEKLEGEQNHWYSEKTELKLCKLYREYYNKIRNT